MTNCAIVVVDPAAVFWLIGSMTILAFVSIILNLRH